MNSSPEEVEAYIKSLEEPRRATQPRRPVAQPSPMLKQLHSSPGNDNSNLAMSLALVAAYTPLFSTPSSADSTPSFDGGGGSFDGGGSSGSF